MYSMNHISIRLNQVEGFRQKMLDFFSGEDYECVFIISHQGKHKDNPHWHLAVITKCTIQTLRARLHAAVGCKGNKQVSMKKWDGKRKYIQYCLHECKTIDEVNDTIEVNRNYAGQWWTDDELKEMLRLTTVITDNIIQNRPKKVMIEIFERLDMSRGYTDQCLFREIMRYYIDKGDWLPNKHQAERYINYLKMMIAEVRDQVRDDTQNMDYFIDRLYENYFLRTW